MSSINNPIAGPDNYRVEFAQICWVIPDIHAAVKFLADGLGIAGFRSRNRSANTICT